MSDIPSEKATWRRMLTFALPIYLVANAYLVYLGEVTATLLRMATVAYLALLVWLTLRATRPLPETEAAPVRRTPALWAQLGVLAAILVLTGLNSDRLPLWTGMVAWLRGVGESVLPVEWFGGPGNAVANPVQYLVVPLLLLLALGARPAELGFTRGHRVWRVCLIWLALPLLTWVGLLASGALAAQTLARRILGNTFQNGFFEEFLFRGALQTRLYRLRASPWMLLLQAVLFGLWHLRANMQSMGGNLLAGLAICIVSQAVTGLAFGIIFRRTRNLVAPSVAHVAMNVLGQSFG